MWPIGFGLVTKGCIGVMLAHKGMSTMLWFAHVSHPQILVDVQDQTRLLVEVGRHGHNGAAVLDVARAARVVSGQ